MFVTTNDSSIDYDESLLVSPTKTEERNEVDGKRAERQLRPWQCRLASDHQSKSASPPSSRTPKITRGASLYNLDELDELEPTPAKSDPFAHRHHPRADQSLSGCSGGASVAIDSIDAKIEQRMTSPYFDRSKSKRTQSLGPTPGPFSNWEEDWDNQQANWDQFEDWDADSASKTDDGRTAGYVNKMRESIESYFSSHSSQSSEDRAGKCDDASDDLHQSEARTSQGGEIGHINREATTLDTYHATSTTRNNLYPDPDEGGRAELRDDLGKHAFQLCLSPILPNSSPHGSSASGRMCDDLDDNDLKEEISRGEVSGRSDHRGGAEEQSFREDAAADTMDDLPPHLRYFRNLHSLETHTGGINPHLNTRFLDRLRDATGEREREPTGNRQSNEPCPFQPRPEEREARRDRGNREEPGDQSSERRSFSTGSDPPRPVKCLTLPASRKDFAFRTHPQQNKADTGKKSIQTHRPLKCILSSETASGAGEMATTQRLQEQGAAIGKRSTFKARPLPSSSLTGEDIVSKPRRGKENVRAFVPISSQRAHERALFNLEKNERYRQRKQKEMQLRAQQIDQARSEASSLKKFI